MCISGVYFFVGGGGDVQCIGGISSVHGGLMICVGRYHECIRGIQCFGGYHECVGGIS